MLSTPPCSVHVHVYIGTYYSQIHRFVVLEVAVWFAPYSRPITPFQDPHVHAVYVYVHRIGLC